MCVGVSVCACLRLEVTVCESVGAGMGPQVLGPLLEPKTGLQDFKLGEVFTEIRITKEGAQ